MRLIRKASRLLLSWLRPAPRLTEVERRSLGQPMTINRKGDPVAVPRWTNGR